MRGNFIGFFVVALTVYTLINYYIGMRLYDAVKFIHIKAPVFWLLFAIISLAYILGRVFSRYTTETIVSNFFTYIGAYWLGAFYYLLLTYFLVDLIGGIGRLTGIVENYWRYRSISSVIVVFLVTLVFIYGVWNARNPKVTNYNINLVKSAGNLKKLNIVVVSDIHLGNLVNKNNLQGLVNEIGKLNPDIVLLPGDIIDEDIRPFVESNMSETFRKLKPQYGMYAVLGNHEYIGGHVEEAAHYIEEGGITMLRDNYVKVNDSFYVVGRDDLSKERFYKTPRKKLKDILNGIDHTLPIILLDHQPSHLQEPENEGIDLMLSGHTHYGQLFPNQYITRRIFEDDWGYLKKGNLNLIVTSGFGTWGPPLRVGTRSEIVQITMNFK